MKRNSLDGLNSRVDKTKEYVSWNLSLGILLKHNNKRERDKKDKKETQKKGPLMKVPS